MKTALWQTAAGRGIYDLSTASTLLDVPVATLRRFVWGYRSSSRSHPPVFAGDYVTAKGLMAVSFLDMTEVKLLRAFRSSGLSLQTLRRASEKAAQYLQTTHPFSTRRLKKLGTRIFAEIEYKTGEERLIEVLTDQFALERIVEPFLEDIDYGTDDMAARWWPLGRDHLVVVDPARSFGRPIVSRVGVPTRVLADAAAAQGGISEAADWFDIASDDVLAAVEFERRVLRRHIAA